MANELDREKIALNIGAVYNPFQRGGK